MAEEAGGVMAHEAGGVGDGLAGMLNVFVDPATTAKYVPSKLSWIWPVVVLCVVHLVFGYLMLPFTMQLADAKMAERSMPPEQLERAQSMAHMITKIVTPLTPVFVIAFLALFALLIKVMYSLMDVRPRYRDVFSLLAACSLIPMLQYIATYIVLRVKGDAITSSDQMTPPFGLDIFFQGSKGMFFALLNFFSIFQIWYLVVLVFGLAYLTKTSKTKALIAITPVWLLPLFFRLLGAMFQR
jgi:Yip1 domain